MTAAAAAAAARATSAARSAAAAAAASKHVGFAASTLSVSVKEQVRYKLLEAFYTPPIYSD